MGPGSLFADGALPVLEPTLPKLQILKFGFFQCASDIVRHLVLALEHWCWVRRNFL